MNIKGKSFGLLVAAGVAALLCVPSTTWAQVAPPLGVAQQFGALGNSGVTGATGTGVLVTGDVGSSPTPSISNFPPSSTVAPFIVHNTGVQPDGVVQQARTDALAAYTFLQLQGPGTVLPDNLTGAVLTSGIYSFTSGAPDLPASTTLTLNGPGIFVFNVGSSLTANVLSNVVGTADPCNIFWRVGTSATLNGVNFWGTVIADASITLGSGANLIGRLLAGTGATGAVTMAGSGGNTIRGCTRTFSTQASPGATLGASISDTATLSGGAVPTGTITFNLYGPNDATCTGSSIFASTIPVSGNGNYVSGSFTPVLAGTYRWIANYSGDTNNAGTTSACNAANENVVIAAPGIAIPTLITQASPGVTLGGTISDTATLSGGVSPTGTITFSLFGPNNAACTGVAIFTSTVPVSGNGIYTSTSFTPTTVGTYRWIANYSGDGGNAATANTCNAPNENVDVRLTTTLVTQASAAAAFGGAISDTATLSGGATPTGTITFNLYGPNNATCTGVAIFTSTVPVSGNGNYVSGTFTPVLAGLYRWIANYSGDANNAGTANVCNAPNESVVVAPAGLALTTLITQASPGVTLGGAISDTATLSGGTAPTGTITFNLYGPNNATCTGAAIFTSTVPVSGNGNYVSGTFTPVLAGLYRWIANYSGDANNAGTANACNAANENVVVAPVGAATPTLTTQASAGVALGAPISDTGTLSGGATPTGTITFNVYGPNDATCTGAVIFTSTVTVNGNGAYLSASFTPTIAGTYRWIANYSGDANNAGVANACNAPNENVAVAAGPGGGPASIPTLSEWAMIMLVALLVLFGLAGIRRRAM